VVWSYAGVRPLYDDGSTNPSAVTRDYTLRLDADTGNAPVLSVFGGKITTYRKLAEHVMEKLRPWFPDMNPPWTDTVPLAGGEAFDAEMQGPDWQTLPAEALAAIKGRHGSRSAHVLLGVKTREHLGTDFGANLYAREIDYMMDHEWAMTGEDVLYRRSKAGLHMSAVQRRQVEEYVARRACRSH
jgi:glycerol-3-phosphate dehydrogenase